MIRSGAIAGYGFTEGHILGSEVAGTVTAVGGGVDQSWAGRRVWAFTGLGGGYAEQAIAPVGEILPSRRRPVIAPGSAPDQAAKILALCQSRYLRPGNWAWSGSRIVSRSGGRP